MLNELQLNSILEDFDVAFWKINLYTKKIAWSPHFSSLVGNPETGEDNFNYFINS